MSIKLEKEVEDRLIASIQRYVGENMDERIGELKARLLLDFCVREIGASVYNQAIRDAQSHMQDKVAEMDGNCYESEFSYWNKKS
ncbi:DUF2164 domain-containing protein [Undibacterium sp.]|uniref:DUF2164 domain-containing protein n=1 Tax=unclassified Undibacterium TaxID=2630295 RepID=UPI00374CDB59